MYVGKWTEGMKYARGDIVNVSESSTYYACTIPHISDHLVYPSLEDVYWVRINIAFLNDFPLIHSQSPDTTTQQSRAPRRAVQLATEETLEERKKQVGLKRKIRTVERKIDEYKRRRISNNGESLREQILLMNVDIETKSYLVDKYDNFAMMSGSDQSKGMAWIKNVCSIPFGQYKPMQVQNGDAPDKIREYFNNIKKTLDKAVYGLEDVKQEILEFVARKISNPDGKGEVLALCGHAGCGKTVLLTSLAEALSLPFHQINCGGMNDVSVLTGHSETYVGAKPGKIVEILQNSGYMNPIIYLDEIDKMSDSKSKEINGILTHLLDEEQNSKFQDNYLSNVPINLSRAFFVVAFNNISQVDNIVSDRMRIIYVDKPSLDDKVIICQDKLIPELMKNINFGDDVCVSISKEVVEQVVVHRTDQETGVRQLKKNMSKVLNRLNFDILTGNVPSNMVSKTDELTTYNITTHYVDSVLYASKDHQDYLSMYI